MRKKSQDSMLYIVSTPIGNPDDISLRALKIVKQVNAVICEEMKEGALFLKTHNISTELEQLNEHNEKEQAPLLIDRLKAGESFALISDCGTPIFADPGRHLLQLALEAEIEIVVVPGASSLMTALVRSGFRADRFTSAGFLSRKSEERTEELYDLSYEPRTVVLMETPYRLMPLLDSAVKVMPDRKAYIGCNLTMPFESHHYGTFSELHSRFTENKFKGEFVIVFEGNEETEGKYYKHYEERTGFKEEPLLPPIATPTVHTPKKSFAELEFIPADQVTEEDRNAERLSLENNESFADRRSDRNSRGSRSSNDRRGGFSSDKRKSSRFGDKKGGFRSDDKRSSYKSDDKRSSYKSDDKRSSYKSDDKRSSYRSDDKRSSYKSDDKRSSYKSDDKRSSYKSDDKRSSYRSDDKRSSYKSDDKRSSYKSDRSGSGRSDSKPSNNKRYSSFDEVGGGLSAPKKRDGGKPRIYNDRNKPNRFSKKR